MRKWIAAHRKMVALVVPAVAWGAGITLFISWGHPPDQVLFNAGLWALFVAGSWYFDARRQRETASRRRRDLSAEVSASRLRHARALRPAHHFQGPGGDVFRAQEYRAEGSQVRHPQGIPGNPVRYRQGRYRRGWPTGVATHDSGRCYRVLRLCLRTAFALPGI